MDWFRSWHGAPNDPKWLVIARKAGVAPGMVSAVAWAVFDHGSQHNERGRVDNFDIETYAVWSGWDEADIQAVIDAMTAKGIIVDGRIAAWEKRQPKREDDSRERINRWRDKQRATANGQPGITQDDALLTRDVTQDNALPAQDVTQCNAPVTHGNAPVTHGNALPAQDVTQCNAPVTHGNAPEEIREDKKREEKNSESAQTPSAIADPVATPSVPVSLTGWTERLRDSSNRQAVLVLMFETLYPGAVDVPSFAYIGRVANKVGGAGRLAELLWQNAAKPPSGDVLAYIQAQVQAHKPSTNGARPQGHNLRELLGLDKED